jgi:hypothetical protein
MAASSSSLANVGLSSAAEPSFYEKLNTQWHERALQLFMMIVLAHWAEHLAQAWEIWGLHWPIPQSNGVIGLWFPWMIKSEVLHYGYALVMLIGIWVLRAGFTGAARKWWTAALVIQFWHHIEHFLLIYQATTHHNFWHKPVPFSIAQLIIPRVQLHLLYNTIVFIPMVIGMYYHMFPPEGEGQHDKCSCAWHPRDQAACAV